MVFCRNEQFFSAAFLLVTEFLRSLGYTCVLVYDSIFLLSFLFPLIINFECQPLNTMTTQSWPLNPRRHGRIRRIRGIILNPPLATVGGFCQAIRTIHNCKILATVNAGTVDHSAGICRRNYSHESYPIEVKLALRVL